MNEFKSIWDTITGTSGKSQEVTTTETKSNYGAIIGGVVLFIAVVFLIYWMAGRNKKAA